MRNFDVLIIGSGLAGQSAALRLASHCRVALVSKRTLEDSASGWAQGGIAAVLDNRDSIEAHIRDTLVAGAWLNDEKATRFVVENGRRAIEWLIDQGVPFTKDEAGYHLTREGGHSARRVIHVADATGSAVQETLTRQGAQQSEYRRSRKSHRDRPDYRRQAGQRRATAASVPMLLDSVNGEVITLGAANTLIATGGAGKVYLYTTNPDTSTGDGIAMAWRAGCRVANMEFIQFHPTCLYHPHAKSFLISEAVRGEGGLLRLPDGTRFMPDHDERAELAPRDIVARAIDFEMKKRGLDCVYLDITHKGEEFIRTHFPNIHARCLELGIDITSEPIPGGAGGALHLRRHRQRPARPHRPARPLCCRRSLLHRPAWRQSPGLELAARMPGFCRGCGQRHSGQQNRALPRLPQWDESRVTDADEEVVISHNWDELRRFMWDYVGIVRTNKRLKRAQHRIRLLMREIEEFYANFRVSHDLIELRNLVVDSRSDRPLCDAAQGKPWPALLARLSGNAAASEKHGSQGSPAPPLTSARQRNQTRKRRSSSGVAESGAITSR